MKIAVIGTGRMGKALSRTLAAHYPDQVLLAGRDFQKTKEIANSLAISPIPSTMEEAVEAADIIVPTLWYKDIFPWIETFQSSLKGKIYIDIINPFNEDFDDFVIPYHTSAAEEIQKVLPNSTVVGCFKNTFWVVFDQPILQGIKSDLFVTSDNDAVRQQVINILQPLPFRVLDAGMLTNNRTIERMTLLSRVIAMNAGSHPRNAYNLWGLEHEGLSA